MELLAWPAQPPVAGLFRANRPSFGCCDQHPGAVFFGKRYSDMPIWSAGRVRLAAVGYKLY